MEIVLEVKNLSTSFATEAGRVQVLNGVNFKVPKGKTVGIVGESGCGKSVTSLSIMRLLPKPSGQVDSGEVIFKDRDLLKLPISDMYQIRGKKVSMIFQEPLTALNPVHKIGKQLGEVFELHFPKMSQQEVWDESVRILKEVGIPEAERRMSEYPHQLSGGMRQRVVIAIALACKPELLFADEPTTALDVTIQAQILKLMKNLQEDIGMSIIFITHDLGVIAQLCDEVVVMYAGKVVERGPVELIFDSPKHPYTKGLLASIPRLDHPRKQTLATIEGMVPDVFNFPSGCRFHTRCPYKIEKCTEAVPPEEWIDGIREVSCIRYKEI
ncbi:MAG: ABC transporter ATP-binding protein [Bacteriovoracaceae bacterium]|jgi:oligopeptide/dipeptide ABC transporter ATP-binding protein|nr:ABC transporter ATP-binding protein [Bacteriovoracaceae bacterium]